MSRRHLVLDDDAVMNAINDSDFGDDCDEDENWVLPGEELDSSKTRRNTFCRPLNTLKIILQKTYSKNSHYTNIYYQTTNNEVLKNPITASEVKKFFGVNGILGCVKFPRIKMAWFQRFKLPYIADALTRDRFCLIRTNLHIVEKAAVQAQDKTQNRLWLVQPVIDMVRKRCLELPRNHGTYSIDEQMVPFLGKCPVKQYVPGKPRPVGLKTFVITSSKGLIMDFEIYQGNTTPFHETTLGLGPCIVLRLISTLSKGSFIFFDRYFTTIPLMEKLTAEQMDRTGTLMTNKFKGYSFTKDSQMKRGDNEEVVNAARNGSTCLGTQPVDNVQRWDKLTKSYVTVPCPNLIKKYNENTGGVDFSDQMMETYRSWHISRKWPVKVFDMSLINAWYEYREASLLNKQKPMDFLDFKLTVSDYLLGGTRKRQRDPTDNLADMPETSYYKRATIPTMVKRLDGYNHWPICDTLKAPR
ncbi:PiggyBac transposable element-derived protein 3 [Eumeta japonica]|uniref:PiggyBac transposable element-derived protein 3 n=1 Tax=Eumeta variegata TaxID=151549 RepID=A0A4C1UX36_EUMVA|nr:PiggyBac transposable element-derived protein 3 [Eumeta japonica]